MTQDEIIEMADKADEEADNILDTKGEYHPNWHEVRDEIFAKLVAAKATASEREACIEACRKTITSQRSAWGANFCIEAIRARGEQA
jgi:hypothetical protein